MPADQHGGAYSTPPPPRHVSAWQQICVWNKTSTQGSRGEAERKSPSAVCVGGKPVSHPAGGRKQIWWRMHLHWIRGVNGGETRTSLGDQLLQTAHTGQMFRKAHRKTGKHLHVRRWFWNQDPQGSGRGPPAENGVFISMTQADSGRASVDPEGLADQWCLVLSASFLKLWLKGFLILKWLVQTKKVLPAM